MIDPDIMKQAVAQEIWDALNASGLAYEAEERRAKLSAKAAIMAINTWLYDSGLVIVPAELDSKSMDHWYVADAGIKVIEDYGGEMGSDHTPELQISTVYKEMIAALSQDQQG